MVGFQTNTTLNYRAISSPLTPGTKQCILQWNLPARLILDLTCSLLWCSYVIVASSPLISFVLVRSRTFVIPNWEKRRQSWLNWHSYGTTITMPNYQKMLHRDFLIDIQFISYSPRHLSENVSNINIKYVVYSWTTS